MVIGAEFSTKCARFYRYRTALCCDLSEDLQNLAQKASSPATKSIDEVLEDEKQTVLLATPPHTHYELALKALRQARMMVEKPLAETSADGKNGFCLHKT